MGGDNNDNVGRSKGSFPLTPPAPQNRSFANDGNGVGNQNGDDMHDASSWQSPTFGNDVTCDTMGAPDAESADQRNMTQPNGGDQAYEVVEVDAITADSMAQRNKSDMPTSGEDAACVVSICPCIREQSCLPWSKSMKGCISLQSTCSKIFIAAGVPNLEGQLQISTRHLMVAGSPSRNGILLETSPRSRYCSTHSKTNIITSFLWKQGVTRYNSWPI